MSKEPEYLKKMLEDYQRNFIMLNEKMSELEKENKTLKEGIKSLLNYCDELYLYEEKPYHITEEGIKFYFLDYEEKEDLEKIKLMFEVLNNGN